MIRYIIVALYAAFLFLFLIASPPRHALAESGCSGQFAAGELCANPSGFLSPPEGVLPSTWLDSIYGTTPGTLIYRSTSTWSALSGNTSGTRFLSETSAGVPSWATVSGTGTVTSVGVALPNIFTISGSPVTSAGTLTGSLASQSQNLVWASPSGSSGVPAFRSLVAGDLPSIAANTLLGNNTSGSLPALAISVPSCSTATSALTWTTSTGFGCNSITGTGTVTSVASGSGLTGGPITTTGTLSLASISANSLLGNAAGGVPAAVSVPSCSAASSALIWTSGSGFGCNTISGSGTVNIPTAATNLAWYGSVTNVVNGNINANISAGALTLGVANTTIGQLVLEGSASGALTITPQSAAGTPTWTAGSASGTPVVTASSPLSITTSTGNITITGAAGEVLGGSGPAFTAQPTLGLSGTTGQVNFVGSGGGTVTLTVNNSAGTWTMKLPTSAGTNGEFLSTDGSGNTSWASAGGGGGGSGTANNIAYYASSGTTSVGNANANIVGGALTLGQATSTIGQLLLAGNTGGTATITPQASAGTPTLTLGNTSGTLVAVASSPLSISATTGTISITGAAGQVLAGSGPAFTAAPTLGASGTPGTLAFGNSTSGTVTLGTVTGALGSATASLPANTGTIAELNLAQTWTAAQAISSASASALAVGLSGSTNPSFVVNDSTALQAAGLSVTGAATGGTVAVATIDSGSNTNLTINAKGSGTIGIGSVSTGSVTITPPATLSSALTYGGVTLSNSVTGTGGSMVLALSPTLVTPTLGAASATSINGLTITSTTSAAITISSGKTFSASNTITLAGTDGITWTGASSNMTLAALNLADQTVTGGANVTSDSLGTVSSGGTVTVDCGSRPLQYLTNNATTTAWTIAAPGVGHDGSCIILVTNNSSGALVAPSFSGFSVGSNTGDTYLTANNDQFSLFVWQVNGVAGYRWAAHQ
jgi:hypothetical protein